VDGLGGPAVEFLDVGLGDVDQAGVLVEPPRPEEHLRADLVVPLGILDDQVVLHQGGQEAKRRGLGKLRLPTDLGDPQGFLRPRQEGQDRDTPLQDPNPAHFRHAGSPFDVIVSF
jgi:hypothetical protein